MQEQKRKTAKKAKYTHSKLCEGVVMCNDTLPRWVCMPPEGTRIVLTLGTDGENNILSTKSGCRGWGRMAVVGRGKDVAIPVDTLEVSRVHAGFLLDYKGQWFVVSLSRTNPTVVDGVRVPFLQPVEVSNGAEFVFHNLGPYTFCAFKGKEVMGPPPVKRFNSVITSGSASKSTKLVANAADTQASPSTPPADDGRKIRCCHILVKHKDSRKPSSWKQEVVTRTHEEAVSYAKALRQLVLAGTITFQELAATESDCMSYKIGGDVGWFGRGDVHKAFEDAAFALNVGGLSDVVDTPSGVHIIFRTG